MLVVVLDNLQRRINEPLVNLSGRCVKGARQGFDLFVLLGLLPEGDVYCFGQCIKV